MKDPQLRIIGDRLRRLRTKNNNFSQEAIAEELGVHVTTYARIESGSAELTILKAMGLARFYHITIDELVGFDYRDPSNVPIVREESVLYGKKQSPTNIILQFSSEGKNSPRVEKFLERLGRALAEGFDEDNDAN